MNTTTDAPEGIMAMTMKMMMNYNPGAKASYADEADEAWTTPLPSSSCSQAWMAERDSSEEVFEELKS